jgi:uncharacterized protein YutE (UPF0331/DUF86 family)
VPFTELLQAGANAARHSQEWWNRIVKSMYELNANSPQDFERVKEHATQTMTTQQKQSLDAIMTALNIELIDAGADIVPDVLRVLSDGDFRKFWERYCLTARDIAEGTKQTVALKNVIIHKWGEKALGGRPERSDSDPA